MYTGNTAMRFHPSEGRPESALSTEVNGAVIAGGVAALVLTPIVLLIFVLVLGAVSLVMSEALGTIIDEAPREEILEEEDVIEARFVQLGRDFQDELPNREVPLLSTAPPQPSEVPTEATPETPPPEVVPNRPPDAVNDLIARLGDRAQAFAEIAEQREREGSPDGIEEGTERQGTEGDIYRGRLYAFFKRGWSIPTTLSADEASGLTAQVRVQIGSELQIVSFEISRPSGNPLFDESVTQQLTRLQAADQRIPPPPEEVASQYVGQAVVVRFSGRQASQ